MALLSLGFNGLDGLVDSFKRSARAFLRGPSLHFLANLSDKLNTLKDGVCLNKLFVLPTRSEHPRIHIG